MSTTKPIFVTPNVVCAHTIYLHEDENWTYLCGDESNISRGMHIKNSGSARDLSIHHSSHPPPFSPRFPPVFPRFSPFFLHPYPLTYVTDFPLFDALVKNPLLYPAPKRRLVAYCSRILGTLDPCAARCGSRRHTAGCRGTLWHAAACYGTLRHAAACDGMWRHAAARCGMLPHAPARCGMRRHAAARYGMRWHATACSGIRRHAAASGGTLRHAVGTLRHATACGGMRRHAAACCRTPRHVAACGGVRRHAAAGTGMLRHAAASGGTLRHAVAHCGMLWHAAARSGIRRHAAASGGTLRHAVAHCGTLPHSAARCGMRQHGAACCGTLWHAATCCGEPRHAAACCGMLQAVGQGYLHFPKAAQVSKTNAKHSESHAPSKCQHCSIKSQLGVFLLLLRRFSFLVNFIDIHHCQMAQRLIAHIRTVMCPNKLKANSTRRLERGLRTKKAAMEDRIGNSAAFTSHQATLAGGVSGRGDGAGKAIYRSHSV